MKKSYKWLKARLLSRKINLIHPDPCTADETDNSLSLSELSISLNRDAERDSDLDYFDRTLDKLTQSELKHSENSNLQGYTSFMKGLLQAQDFDLPRPEDSELTALMIEPERPTLFQNVDSESWNLISELLQASKELKQQGYPIDGTMKIRKRWPRLRRSLNYTLGPRFQLTRHNKIRKHR